MSGVLIGNLIKVEAVFKDKSGVKRDPAYVQVRRMKPGDVAPTTYVYGVDPEVVRVETGVYYIENDTTDLPGTWQFVWNSTGTYQAAGETQFIVEPDLFS